MRITTARFESLRGLTIGDDFQYNNQAWRISGSNDAEIRALPITRIGGKREKGRAVAFFTRSATSTERGAKSRAKARKENRLRKEFSLTPDENIFLLQKLNEYRGRKL